MMKEFVYEYPTKVYFGEGRRKSTWQEPQLLTVKM